MRAIKLRLEFDLSQVKALDGQLLFAINGGRQRAIQLRADTERSFIAEIPGELLGVGARVNYAFLLRALHEDGACGGRRTSVLPARFSYESIVHAGGQLPATPAARAAAVRALAGALQDYAPDWPEDPARSLKVACQERFISPSPCEAIASPTLSAPAPPEPRSGTLAVLALPIISDVETGQKTCELKKPFWFSRGPVVPVSRGIDGFVAPVPFGLQSASVVHSEEPGANAGYIREDADFMGFGEIYIDSWEEVGINVSIAKGSATTSATNVSVEAELSWGAFGHVTAGVAPTLPGPFSPVQYAKGEVSRLWVQVGIQKNDGTLPTGDPFSRDTVWTGEDHVENTSYHPVNLLNPLPLWTESDEARGASDDYTWSSTISLPVNKPNEWHAFRARLNVRSRALAWNSRAYARADFFVDTGFVNTPKLRLTLQPGSGSWASC